jgi:hypothetical protein
MAGFLGTTELADDRIQLPRREPDAATMLRTSMESMEGFWRLVPWHAIRSQTRYADTELAGESRWDYTSAVGDYAKLWLEPHNDVPVTIA